MSDSCVICGKMFDKHICPVFIGLGGTLLLTCLILFGITCTQCRRLKRLKHYGEGSSYKRSKTCKHYRLSMRELQEQEDAWDKENGFSSFEPMITIGSAFDSPHHGPTPPLPPPKPKEYLNTDCKATGTDGRLKRLPRSKESSYKTSKTSERYTLSVRERYKWKETWNEEDSVTSIAPMMTIGSAFGSPYHGPTPTSPPPPTDEFNNTGYCQNETESRPREHGQIPTVAEHRFKKKVPLKSPLCKTLPIALGRGCLEDLDYVFNTTTAVGPLCHTLDYRLDQLDRQEHPSLTDAWYNQPSEWNRHPDDCSPYYIGKLSDQNLRESKPIHGSDVFDVNEILRNANAIEVIHKSSVIENMYENLDSLRERKKTQNLNPAFRESIESYIDMSASSEGDEYVQMKITLTKSAASEICRKAKLRGISCTSDVLNAYVMDKETNSSVDDRVADSLSTH